LRKKLRDRSDKYKYEVENVGDIKDLVAGRVILARWADFENVEKVIHSKFFVSTFGLVFIVPSHISSSNHRIHCSLAHYYVRY